MSEEYENNQGQQFSQDAPQDSMNGTSTEQTTYSWVNPKVNPHAYDDGSDMAKHAAETIGAGSTYNNTYNQDTTANTANTTNAYGSNTYDSNTYDNNTYPNGQPHTYSSYQFGTSQQTDANSQSQAQTGSRSFHTEHPKSKRTRTKKPMTTQKRWASTVAMAVVFGLVAGSVTYGVNYAGNKIGGSGASTPVVQSTTTAGSSSSGTVSSAVASDTSSFSVKDVASSVMPSMVAISTETVSTVQSFFGTYSQTVPASGTGVIVGQNDDELLIATNNHVIEGANSVSVAFIDESAVSAEIKGTDTSNDLAVVAVKLSDISEDTLNQIKVATLGNSDDLAVGEQVVAIGNALGYGQSVTTGIVSATDRSVTTQSETTGETSTSDGLIQTDAAINPGNSGGALLNMKGELIGINEAKYSSTSVEGVGFAIPLAKAEPILENLMNMETRSQVADDQASYIGITGVNVSSDINSSYGVPIGVYVETVESGGPAEDAGIQSKDVITKLDTRSITTMTELQNALKYYAKGETVDVVIQRMEDGEYVEKTISITLGDRSNMKSTTGSTAESDGSNSDGSSNNSGQGQQQQPNSIFGN